MASPISTFDESRLLMIAAMSGRFPGAALSRHNDLYKRISAIALGITDNHFHTRQVGLDVMPDTAAKDFLTRHGTIWGVYRKAAVGGLATVGLRVVGTPGAAVPNLEPMTHPASGLLFETRSAGVIPAGGSLDVNVGAISTGIQTNLEVGQELQFDITPVGLVAGAAIVVELTQGIDEESDNDLRDRILNRIGEPAAGGNRNDWEQFVIEALASVATAYVYPNRNGLGTVDLVGLKAGSGSARTLSAGENATILTAVDALRPVTATARMLTVTTSDTDVEITLVPESDPVNAFDWIDSVPPTIASYVSGTRKLTFDLDRPASMAIGHRLSINDPLSDGAESVIEALSGTNAVILEVDIGYAPTPANSVYAGGPLVQPARLAVIALFDELGSANPDANPYGPWEGNLRLSSLFEAVQSGDGVLDSTIVDPVANVEATDPAFPINSTIELLTPGKILVRKT